CGSPALSAHSVSTLFDSRGTQCARLHQTGRHAGARDAPHDGSVPLSTLAFFRRLSPRVPARRLPRERDSTALGQYELGLGSMPALGGVSSVASVAREHAEPAKAEIPDLD